MQNTLQHLLLAKRLDGATLEVVVVLSKVLNTLPESYSFKEEGCNVGKLSLK